MEDCKEILIPYVVGIIAGIPLGMAIILLILR